MSTSSEENLLARLARKNNGQEDHAWAAVAATQPSHEPVDEPVGEDEKLNSLLKRIKNLASSGGSSSTQTNSAQNAGTAFPGDSNEWMPLEPSSFRGGGLTENEVEALVLKFLLMRGEATGRDIADQVKLPFVLVDPLLRQMKFEQLVAYRGTAPMNDYTYQLTDLGRERGRRHSEHCTYCGSAPVPLHDYVESVRSQSLDGQHPTMDDLRRAFDDLLINPKMFGRLGPAINSGRGMFLYGFPGNGKTSIAERVTRAFGQHIWIPRCLGIDGEILRVFDPMNHIEAPLEKSDGLLDKSRIDRRWVRVVRPTIVVGGELTMENLEVQYNSATGICESPVQMKSNCGTLVIDDFGRQKMRTDELLNRWIVPLEKRVDFLNLPSGKKIQVPFDQLVIFSTNLQPKDLVDDAFLRRIPYKIEVPNPSEEEYRKLIQIIAPKMGFEYNESAISYLINKYYTAVNRPFRCCQPRDLLLQVRNYCLFQEQPLELTCENLDFAVENYFAVME